MSKFKKGDKVIRTGPSDYGVVKGQKYVVDFCKGCMYLEGFDVNYDPDLFELAPKLTPHVCVNIDIEQPKFKKGDEVIRTGPSNLGLIQGNTYTVSSCEGKFLSLEGSGCLYDTDYFELATKLTPHAHAKEIKAWADGHKIQCMPNFRTVWQNAASPTWIPKFKYRVAPDNSVEIARLEKSIEVAEVKVALERKHLGELNEKLSELLW